DGGRVTRMRLVFSGGSVELSGADFRSAFYNDVWSDWFKPVGTAGGQPVNPDTGLDLGCPAPGYGALQRLYTAFFLRAPDAGGWAHWAKEIDSGRSMASIAGYFAGSPEFVARYGTLNNADFVELLYNGVLGRQAEPTGKAYWVDLLDSRRRRAPARRHRATLDGRVPTGRQTDLGGRPGTGWGTDGTLGGAARAGGVRGQVGVRAMTAYSWGRKSSWLGGSSEGLSAASTA